MTAASSSVDAGTLFLLRIEGQNFSSVIYDTHDLSTIAGGSRLLEIAPEKIKEILKPGVAGVKAVRTIQCVAAIGLFAVRAESKDIASILQRVRDELAKSPYFHLTVSVEAIECPDVTAIADQDGKYSIPNEELRQIPMGRVDQLQAAARFAQMRASNIAIPEVHSNSLKACSTDHFRPDEGNGNQAMSASVHERKNYGKKFRRQSGTTGIDTVQTFDEMTEWKQAGKERLNGRLAVISIDGKGFSRLRDKLCTNLDDFRWFSDQLTSLQISFLDSLREQWGNNKDDKRYFLDYSPTTEEAERGRTAGKLFRLQSLVSAGDDSVFLMPAWLAWGFLTQFYSWTWRLNPEADGSTSEVVRHRAEVLDKLAPAGLCFRAGVVICGAKTPIHPIRDLAHKLESEVAKNDAPNNADGNETIQNPIAYEVLKSFDFIGPELKEYRKQRRSGLEPGDVLLDGTSLPSLKAYLKKLNMEAPSGKIKNPDQWPRDAITGRLKPKEAIPYFHLSQWRDYLDLEGEQP